MLEDVLRDFGGTEVSAMEVYGRIFRLGDHMIQAWKGGSRDMVANPIGYFKNSKEKYGHFRIMFEDNFEEWLQELQEADFAILNGLTYFGAKNLQAHASKCYALIFDLDGVDETKLYNFLYGANFKDADIYPLPNYIALSGHGVHLYYVFDNPIPLFPNLKLQLKALKYALIERIWNPVTSNEPKIQYQGINQGFRVIGGKSKIDGVRVRAFDMHQHFYDLTELNRYVPDDVAVDESKLYKEKHISLAEAKKKYPAWYEKVIVNGGKCKGRWTTNRALYDWWKQILEKGNATYHHRYFSIMCLAIYAVKAGISYEELEKDAKGYIPMLNAINPQEPFTEEDVMSALECYDERYVTFPRDDIAKISNISIPANTRNGNTRAKHLEIVHKLRAIKDPEGKWRYKGGAPTKQHIIRKWRITHPDGRKCDFLNDPEVKNLVCRTTLYKWWDECKP